MQKLLSHPEQTLYEHLNGVCKWGMHYLENSSSTITKEIKEELLYDFFAFHDIGKSTAYFQNYIREEKVDSRKKSHAKLSAILFVSYRVLKGIAEGEEDTIALMFYAILKHHGDLKDITEVNNFRIEEYDIEELKSQWDSIDKEQLLETMLECGLNNGQQLLEKDIEALAAFTMEFLGKRRRKLRKKRRQNQGSSGQNNLDEMDFHEYFQLQMLYSLLIDADKSQVGLRKINLVQRVDYKANISAYLENKDVKDTVLNRMRREAFQAVEKNISSQHSLFTLTLPTGMGKTLNSFNAALKLKDELYTTYHKKYRIIYVMPFMSIIDQNANVIEDILKQQNKEINHAMLTKHHHLTELSWSTNENIWLDSQNAKLLMEGWNSEIIVTTFHQFFLTLIGYRNAMQRKFNKLANAIILIDEIQAIPVKYYKLIGHMLKKYVKHMDSKVIAMTATQPHIFDTGESCELCDSKKYYQSLSRTKIINQLEQQITIEELLEKVDCDRDKTYLFIMNTIRSAKKCYEGLCKKYDEKNITFLSTLLPPTVRMKRIKEIKAGKYAMVVSTQLVEAGVDIDFDVVYRDLAPLPSIFQSAGRANREGDIHKIGMVYVVKLHEEGKKYCDMVYRNSFVDIAITESVMKEKEYNESEFMDVINKYFDKVSDETVKSQFESNAIMKGIKEGYFFSQSYEKQDRMYPVSSFELIEEQGRRNSIFIELDDKAKHLWNDYIELSESRSNDWEEKTKFKSILRKMAEYIVDVSDSVFEESNKPPIDQNGIYYYVANDEIERYYDNDIGYGVQSATYFID